MAEVRIEIAGEEIQLLGGRAAFWPARKWLVCADLHWGKAEIFQHFGLAVPGNLLEKDLDRLALMVRECGAEKILVLGDLIHSRLGSTGEVRKTVADFFAAESE